MKNFRILFILFFSMLTTVNIFSQIEIELWSDQIPYFQENQGKEVWSGGHEKVTNVQKPSIRIYLPLRKEAKVPAVIICPGGGYEFEAIAHEGYDFAKFLSQNGIAGIVLKYRLPKGDPRIPLSDLQEAIREIRKRADQLNIAPHSIGVMGFSAGGHLASLATIWTESHPLHTASSLIDKRSNPDFGILFYPVISTDSTIYHQGSFNKLLGNGWQNDTLSLRSYSTDQMIHPFTPACLLFHSLDDKAVPVENSYRFRENMMQKGRKCTLHTFPVGGHGWGFRKSFPYHYDMTEKLLTWLKEESWLQ